MKLDFGSGHNPKKGYYSCDITGNPKLDFHCDPDTFCIFDKLGYEDTCLFEEIHIRNVIHHINNLERFFTSLKFKLTFDGILTIIDCNEEYYQKNLTLDILWYRYLIPRYDIYICKKYRDIEPIMESLGFELISKRCKEEKITYKWKVKS